MAVETATYISDLVSTNPVSSDPKSAGDDHLRLLKSTIKSTLPNVAGAVTPTHTELNFVGGVTSAIQTQMDLKAPKANPALTGTATLVNQETSGTAAFTGTVTINGTLDMNAGTASTITGLAEPSGTTDAATKNYVDTKVAALVNAAPAALDTLKELSDALGGDANYAATITSALGTKLALAGGTMSGPINMGSQKITALVAPTAGNDAVNLTYVTDLFGSTATAAASASTATTQAGIATTQASNASASAAAATAQVNSAAAQVTLATTQAQAAAASAASTAGVVAAAQAYASAAQATNPDSPIHTNQREITANFTLGSGYNGWSAGPITISESATLTIADNATLSII